MADILSVKCQLLDTKAAAAYLSISVKSLERYRRLKQPDIPYIKFPGRNGPVRYSKTDLDVFLLASSRGLTEDRRR